MARILRNQNPYTHIHVAERWKDIQGCHSWVNMLDTNKAWKVLQAELCRYGDIATASYDSFQHDEKAPNYLGCKYSKEDLLTNIGLDNCGYEIIDYLYSTYCKKTMWMGFVARCTSAEEYARLGRWDIVVAFRGTVTMHDFWQDIQCNLITPRSATLGDCKNCVRKAIEICVAHGFHTIFKGLRESLLKAVNDAVNAYTSKGIGRDKLSITFTGHSLGSALAILGAQLIASDPKFAIPPKDKDKENSQILKRFQYGIPITVMSFAGPRVGNRAFKSHLEELGVAVLRVVAKHDVVPKLLNGWTSKFKSNLLQKLLSPTSYKHVGIKLEINTSEPLFLRPCVPLWVRSHKLVFLLDKVKRFDGDDYGAPLWEGENLDKSYPERAVGRAVRTYKSLGKLAGDLKLVGKLNATIGNKSTSYWSNVSERMEKTLDDIESKIPQLGVERSTKTKLYYALFWLVFFAVLI